MKCHIVGMRNETQGENGEKILVPSVEEINKNIGTIDILSITGKWGNGSMWRTFYKIEFLEHLKNHFFGVRTLSEYCIDVALIFISMYINIVLYFLPCTLI